MGSVPLTTAIVLAADGMPACDIGRAVQITGGIDGGVLRAGPLYQL